MTYTKLHIQEVQRNQEGWMLEDKKPTPRHITFPAQKTKDKENVLKGVREQMHFTHKSHSPLHSHEFPPFSKRS